MIVFRSLLSWFCVIACLSSPAWGAVSGSKKSPARPKPVPLTQVFEVIEKAARYYDLNPRLVMAVIEQESGFHPGAVSPAQAKGIMQFMAETGRRFRLRYNPQHGIDDRLNFDMCIWTGCEYLRELLNLFDGNVALALAGYNAGEHRVIRSGYTVPKIRETQNYVKSILARMQRGVRYETEFRQWIQNQGGNPAAQPLETSPPANAPEIPDDTTIIYIRRQ